MSGLKNSKKPAPQERVSLFDGWIGLKCVDNGHKAVSFQRGSTVKPSAHVGVGEEFFGISGIAASAIQDRGVVGYLFSVLVSDGFTDESVHFLCLFGSGRFTGTDSPNGFVRQDDLSEIFGREIEQGFFNLGLYYVEMFAGFSLFQYFADTEDRGQSVFERQSNFVFENSGGFSVECTTFGVSQNHVFGSG